MNSGWFEIYCISRVYIGMMNYIHRELISDANPTVVANAVAALTEIQDLSGKKDIMQATTPVLQKLLAALNECTEWGMKFFDKNFYFG
jgi:vesicle coat complex subunit